jgi:hypothetical protein
MTPSLTSVVLKLFCAPFDAEQTSRLKLCTAKVAANSGGRQKQQR